MKILIIGGNRFVGLRVSMAFDAEKIHDLHILNRTGQVAHVKNAVLHKGDRTSLHGAFLDKDWDLIYDFAGYTAADARESLSFFGQVGRYVFISTSSIYDQNVPRAESDFDAAKWDAGAPPSAQEKTDSYQFGKRQAEAAFTQQNRFPVVLVRFPYILGPDDYTRRLHFHFERVRDGQPIYMPNPQAKISVVQSEDAANFLLWCGRQTFTGPVNVASPDGLGLNELIQLCEASTGRKALLLQTGSAANHSPYGTKFDEVLDVRKVQSLGYKPKSWKNWLPELIAALGGPEKMGRLH